MTSECGFEALYQEQVNTTGKKLFTKCSLLAINRRSMLCSGYWECSKILMNMDF